MWGARVTRAFLNFHYREDRRLIPIFDRKDIALLGALKLARTLWGAVQIAAATADTRARDFGALRPSSQETLIRNPLAALL